MHIGLRLYITICVRYDISDTLNYTEVHVENPASETEFQFYMGKCGKLKYIYTERTLVICL